MDFWRKITSKPTQVIPLGFMATILVGTLVLMLPVCSASGTWTPFSDALFTATSATCVTGLVVQNTATYWSLVGQVVILVLIQIGGMGVITFATAIFMIAGRKIGLKQRWIMQESISAPYVGGILNQTRFILTCAVGIELTGAVLLTFRFVPQFGLARGLWYSVFHAISAFCNAGFDLMGYDEAYCSLTAYGSDPWVLGVVSVLIVVGGIGFLTWSDLREHKLHWKRYCLQTKLVLSTTLILLIIGFASFMREFTLARWDPYFDSFGERVLAAIFQAITPRTAGFNAVDYGNLSEGGVFFTILLMLVGCSPGSTAGGFKVTTLSVLIVTMVSVFRGKKHAEVFHRRVPTQMQRSASALFTLYLLLFITAGVCISSLDDLPLSEAMFESASAVGTVGLSMGITSTLSQASRAILICLMFLGRAGGLTLMYALVERDNAYKMKYPQEPVAIG